MCREASKKASLLVDTTVLDTSKEPLKLPAFESAVMVAATKALESWRDEALEGAPGFVWPFPSFTCVPNQYKIACKV